MQDVVGQLTFGGVGDLLLRRCANESVAMREASEQVTVLLALKICRARLQVLDNLRMDLAFIYGPIGSYIHWQ